MDFLVDKNRKREQFVQELVLFVTLKNHLVAIEMQLSSTVHETNIKSVILEQAASLLLTVSQILRIAE